MAEVLENLDETESYLWALLSDESGLDQAEFFWPDAESEDGVWRAWPFQWRWFRNTAPLQVDQCARSVGKSLSIKLRAFAFPFIHPGQEMTITAPELVHLLPIIGLVENQFLSTRIGRELLPKGTNHGITHRPFEMDFRNGARIFGRIPQRDGKGMKGCVVGETPILTQRGIVCAEDIVVGDLVLTHKGNWKPVIDVQVDENDCYEVRGQSSFPLTVSCDHRFYGRPNEATSKQKRRLGDTWFHDVDALLQRQVYWASPTEFPALPVPDVEFPAGTRRFATSGEAFWWLVGRYIADGHITHHRPNQKSGSVNWCVVPERSDEITERLHQLGLTERREVRERSSADILSVNSSPWSLWLETHFGRKAKSKKLPTFVLGMAEADRSALLAGYLSGDGHIDKEKNRIQVGTASRLLAVGVQLLAQSLGYTVNCTKLSPKPNDFCAAPLPSWTLQLTTNGHPFAENGLLFSKVKSVVPVGKRKIYNPIVDEHHSYVTGSIISHNVHPLWLEMDEAQDYPDPGWIETIETLKRGHHGAVWRVHGVTRGVRDYFYKFTQPESGWTVHRMTAMHRPTWSDQERQEKIESYGSKENPDYRRNVLGLHGDATNPLFVLHRLMECTDTDQNSPYNTTEYKSFRVNAEMLEDVGGDITALLDFPLSHFRKYKTFWIGMDVGYTNHPSEILVFADVTENQKDKFKLVSRIHLQRVSHGDQVMAIKHIVDCYKPKSFAMDKTGLGLPLFQDLQERFPNVAEVIKGYNFSGKILVDFDKTVEVDEYRGDMIKDAGIERNVLEYASDVLRDMVDHHSLQLPWDTDLLGEFQGQTYVVVRDTMTLYGKRSYSQGKFHALDAARMAALGKVQTPIEEFVKRDKYEPIVPVFVGF